MAGIKVMTEDGMKHLIDKSKEAFVGKTGSETIEGDKTFASSVKMRASDEIGLVVTRSDKSFEDGWNRYRWDRTYNKDEQCVNEILGTGDANTSALALIANFYDSEGAKSTASMGVRMYANGTSEGYAPATTDDLADNAIVTKKYLLDKIATLEARLSALEGQ